MAGLSARGAGHVWRGRRVVCGVFAFAHRARTARLAASDRSTFVVPRHRAVAAAWANARRSSFVSLRIRAGPPRRPMAAKSGARVGFTRLAVTDTHLCAIVTRLVATITHSCASYHVWHVLTSDTSSTYVDHGGDLS